MTRQEYNRVHHLLKGSGEVSDANILERKGYIKRTKEGDYRLTSRGREHAKRIASR